MSDYSVRKFFIAPHDNWVLVEMDFSQLEVACLAEIAQEQVLVKELNSGVDIHMANAEFWLGRKPTPEERKQAKVITFQMQYGASAQAIASSTGLPVNDVKNFISAYYTKYKRIKEYHDSLQRIRFLALKNSLDSATLYDPFGRAYKIKRKQDDTGKDYISMPEMKNYPIQGFGGGGTVPVICNRINRHLYRQHSGNVREVVRPINTVHDSIMWEVRNDHVLFLFACIEYTFIEIPNIFKTLFDFEPKVMYNYDISVGPSWSDMDKYSRRDIQLLLKEERTDNG